MILKQSHERHERSPKHVAWGATGATSATTEATHHGLGELHHLRVTHELLNLGETVREGQYHVMTKKLKAKHTQGYRRLSPCARPWSAPQGWT